jgi:hypothetical protein
MNKRKGKQKGHSEYLMKETAKQEKILCPKAGMTTGSRKQATGLLTSLRGMKKFWSGLRETRRSSQALFPGKGRRFKSGQPHQPCCQQGLLSNRLESFGGSFSGKISASTTSV